MVVGHAGYRYLPAQRALVGGGGGGGGGGGRSDVQGMRSREVGGQGDRVQCVFDDSGSQGGDWVCCPLRLTPVDLSGGCLICLDRAFPSLAPLDPPWNTADAEIKVLDFPFGGRSPELSKVHFFSACVSMSECICACFALLSGLFVTHLGCSASSSALLSELFVTHLLSFQFSLAVRTVYYSPGLLSFQFSLAVRAVCYSPAQLPVQPCCQGC